MVWFVTTKLKVATRNIWIHTRCALQTSFYEYPNPHSACFRFTKSWTSQVLRREAGRFPAGHSYFLGLLKKNSALYSTLTGIQFTSQYNPNLVAQKSTLTSNFHMQLSHPQHTFHNLVHPKALSFHYANGAWPTLRSIKPFFAQVSPWSLPSYLFITLFSAPSTF